MLETLTGDAAHDIIPIDILISLVLTDNRNLLPCAFAINRRAEVGRRGIEALDVPPLLVPLIIVLPFREMEHLGVACRVVKGHRVLLDRVDYPLILCPYPVPPWRPNLEPRVKIPHPVRALEGRVIGIPLMV